MAHIHRFVAQSQLHLCREFEQSQKVGNGGALFTDSLAQSLLRELVLVDELAEGEGYFNGVEVFALNVFDERHFGDLAVVGCAHIRRHRFQPGEFGGAKPSFTRYNHICAGVGSPHGEWLNDAVLAYGCCQLLECFLVEIGARLVGVGFDEVDCYFIDCRTAAWLHIVH